MKNVDVRKSLLPCLRGKVSGVIEPMLVRGFTVAPVLGPYTILALGENAASTRDARCCTRLTVISVEIVCGNSGEGVSYGTGEW